MDPEASDRCISQTSYVYEPEPGTLPSARRVQHTLHEQRYCQLEFRGSKTAIARLHLFVAMSCLFILSLWIRAGSSPVTDTLVTLTTGTGKGGAARSTGHVRLPDHWPDSEVVTRGFAK